MSVSLFVSELQNMQNKVKEIKKQLLGFFKILHEIILNLDNLFSELHIPHILPLHTKTQIKSRLSERCSAKHVGVS